MEQPKILDRMRAVLRTRHYSIPTEDSYVQWARRFILFHGKKHPSAMGAAEINAFLSHLAVERNVSASTRDAGALRFCFSIATYSSKKFRGCRNWSVCRGSSGRRWF